MPLIASQIGTIMDVSTQIAIRLPDGLVAWLDEQVAAGAGSRAEVARRALIRYQRHLDAVRDAEIYLKAGGYPDLSGMHDDGDHSHLEGLA